MPVELPGLIFGRYYNEFLRDGLSLQNWQLMFLTAGPPTIRPLWFARMFFEIARQAITFIGMRSLINHHTNFYCVRLYHLVFSFIIISAQLGKFDGVEQIFPIDYNDVRPIVILHDLWWHAATLCKHGQGLCAK